MVELCNVCTETETEIEIDRELRARAVVSMWFDLITALLDFAVIFGSSLGVSLECSYRDLWLWILDFDHF